MFDFPLEENILDVVLKRQRHVKNGVLPKTVQSGLPVAIAEQTVRRYMARMWADGRLFRYGGTSARRGYRTLKAAEVVIEALVLDLLRRNPWGLTSERVAKVLGVREDEVVAYLPQMEYRGLLLFNRGAWRLPSPIQRLAFDTCGTFGYRAA